MPDRKTIALLVLLAGTIYAQHRLMAEVSRRAEADATPPPAAGQPWLNGSIPHPSVVLEPTDGEPAG